MRLDTFSRAIPMLATLKTMRSGGVPVTSAVHRLIANGNMARDLNAWPEAAEAYAAALERAPELFHIWIQRGHALKKPVSSRRRRQPIYAPANSIPDTRIPFCIWDTPRSYAEICPVPPSIISRPRAACQLQLMRSRNCDLLR